MKIYIVLIIVFLVLFFSRTYLKGWLVTFLEKRNKKKPLAVIENDLIYTPILSSRTFNFTIQVDEVGEGKATLSIVKNKD